MLTRRRLGIGLGALLAARPGRVLAQPRPAVDLAAGFAAIEARSGGRLGVAIRDAETGREWHHRGDERFPLCSTFKALAAAAVLAKVDRGEDALTRRVRFAAADLVPYSPTTKEHAGSEGMTLAAICEAAITLSDNTAGNLMLGAIDGPAGLTAFLRGLGDPQTRLDRTEPTLNEARPGDPRDTTTPRAMAATLERLVVGDALAPGSRDQLAAWLLATRTGDARLRAGVLRDWRVGDKTGTGDQGTANDVAVIRPPGRKPLVVAAYITQSGASLDERNAAIAAVGRVAAQAIKG